MKGIRSNWNILCTMWWLLWMRADAYQYGNYCVCFFTRIQVHSCRNCVVNKCDWRSLTNWKENIWKPTKRISKTITTSIDWLKTSHSAWFGSWISSLHSILCVKLKFEWVTQFVTMSSQTWFKILSVFFRGSCRCWCSRAVWPFDIWIIITVNKKTRIIRIKVDDLFVFVNDSPAIFLWRFFAFTLYEKKSKYCNFIENLCVIHVVSIRCNDLLGRLEKIAISSRK